jgi:hypothetical protein
MAAQLQYTIAAGVKRPRQDDKPAATVLMDTSVYPVKPSLPRSTSGKPCFFLSFVLSQLLQRNGLIDCWSLYGGELETLTPQQLETIKCPRFLPVITQNPSIWRPQLILPDSNDSIPLVTREILHKMGDPKLLLEETYDVPGAVPRSFFVVMAHRGIAHSFIFDFPDHAWFHDLAGLRKVSKNRDWKRGASPRSLARPY